MSGATRTMQRVREICLAFEGARETPTWGKPHFRVGDKIFAGCEDEDGVVVIGFKLEKPAAAALIASDTRCSKAPYVGHAGWVSMRLEGALDWRTIAALLATSYELIAPKRRARKPGPVARGRVKPAAKRGAATSQRRGRNAR
ncbi:MAG: MmcQ/YjbR family DNA-binding protein [Planctomycetes bacterium]|nr:MmcQ/YjbR family DNA-binding protein [Planctomycetota bacterium]